MKSKTSVGWFIAALIVLLTIITASDAQTSESYLYGYVTPDVIPLYLEPSADGRQFQNYERVRGSAIMVGRNYVMPDAILRVRQVNDEFAEVVTDSTWDVYEKATVYVRLADLEIIPETDLEPLGYLVNPGSQKSIVVVVSTNTVALMEGDQVAYKGHVVVNPRVPDADPEGTPRGSWILSQTSVSRDMPGRLQEDGTRLPGYPGVGWASLLSGSDSVNRYGYWFHTSSWFEWENLTPADLANLKTGGCVSSPTWYMDVEGLGSIRADQLLWRWAGGNPEAAQVVRHRLQDIVRVYIVDYEWQLLEGNYSRTIRSTGYNPQTFHDAFMTAPYNERSQ